MNLTRIAILGVALIAGVAAAMLMYGMLGNGPAPSEASVPAATTTTDVLVASKDIAPGQSLDAGLVRWEAWPKTAVSDAFITKDEQPDLSMAVAGITVRAPLVIGQPITEASIVRAGAAGFLAATIKPGLRAVGVPVSAETGAGGFILPNDRVDVVLSRDMSGGGNVKIFQSDTILRDVRVLAVDQTAQQQKDQQSVVAKTATLELTPAQAELIARSQLEGVLSLALRALGDSSGEPVTQIATRRAPPPVQRSNPERSNPDRGVVTVFRYGVKREAEPGIGVVASAGTGAGASAGAGASNALADIGNPVSVTVVPAAVPGIPQ